MSSAWAESDMAISIDTGFPGGNVIVDRIEGDTVHLRPDLRDTEGWWFYWNFRVSGASGRTLHFDFGDRSPIGVRGPAVSVDGGITWSWLGGDHVEGAAFAFSFPADCDMAWFAFTVPYQESDLRRFLATRQRPGIIVEETLCTTAKGRPVEILRAGCLDGEPRHRVLLTARHHACETMASFALEGILDALLAADEDGNWWRSNVEVLAVPFVDKDGVEDGDQGKNRRPRDHNRDYIGDSIYAETAALRARIPNWSKGKLHIALDLHCPYIRGDRNEEIYLVGSPDDDMWKQQQAFGATLEAVNESPLPYHASSSLPFGQGWNKDDNYTSGKSFCRWAGELEGVRLSATLEIAYANADGAEVSIASARAFGRSLARAMRTYLEGLAVERPQGR
ncbi:MAG TPA: M14 family zinc carboxypeptidase [Candidatus Hydrogenedentes bacterium]|nr:M14 family zinc carboxypeptidase [Candidatus Hydrogenedentota bacterium]